MSDQVKTFREVSLAIASVEKQFRWHTGVFAAFAVASLGVAGFLYTKMDRVEDATVRVETQLSAIQEVLTKIEKNTHTAALPADAPASRLLSAPNPSDLIAKLVFDPQANGLRPVDEI